MALTSAEKMRAARQRAREAGLCERCCKRKAAKGKTQCKPCYEDRKKRLYRDRAIAGTWNPTGHIRGLRRTKRDQAGLDVVF